MRLSIFTCVDTEKSLKWRFLRVHADLSVKHSVRDKFTGYLLYVLSVTCPEWMILPDVDFKADPDQNSWSEVLKPGQASWKSILDQASMLKPRALTNWTYEAGLQWNPLPGKNQRAASKLIAVAQPTGIFQPRRSGEVRWIFTLTYAMLLISKGSMWVEWTSALRTEYLRVNP